MIEASPEVRDNESLFLFQQQPWPQQLTIVSEMQLQRQMLRSLPCRLCVCVCLSEGYSIYLHFRGVRGGQGWDFFKDFHSVR